ncbi:MAG TPA: RecX family transcriptional regulator [Candidatus Saccharimonadales bacterium]
MKITGITQQQKRQGRYSIFVDGRYAFSLSESALLDSHVASGQELTPAQVKKYKQLSADDKLYNLALRYAVMRPHSRWELETYLTRKGASPSLLERILNKLSKIDLLDDAAFARGWIANRRLLGARSRRRLAQELRAKRVSDEILEQVLREDDTDEQSVLIDLVARKRKQAKYQDDTKLMQYLARQGFSYDDIREVIKNM